MRGEGLSLASVARGQPCKSSVGAAEGAESTDPLSRRPPPIGRKDRADLCLLDRTRATALALPGRLLSYVERRELGVRVGFRNWKHGNVWPLGWTVCEVWCEWWALCVGVRIWVAV